MPTANFELPAGIPSYRARALLRAPQSRVAQLLRQARKFQPQELRQGLAALADADEALKSSSPDPKAVVELLVVQLTGGTRAAQPAGAR